MLLLLLKTQSCVSWDTVFITQYWDPVRFFGMKLKESYFSFHPYAPKVKEYWHLIWHTITVYSISNCFPASLNFFRLSFRNCIEKLRVNYDDLLYIYFFILQFKYMRFIHSSIQQVFYSVLYFISLLSLYVGNSRQYNSSPEFHPPAEIPRRQFNFYL